MTNANKNPVTLEKNAAPKAIEPTKFTAGYISEHAATTQKTAFNSVAAAIGKDAAAQETKGESLRKVGFYLFNAANEAKELGNIINRVGKFYVQFKDSLKATYLTAASEIANPLVRNTTEKGWDSYFGQVLRYCAKAAVDLGKVKGADLAEANAVIVRYSGNKGKGTNAKKGDGKTDTRIATALTEAMLAYLRMKEGKRGKISEANLETAMELIKSAGKYFDVSFEALEKAEEVKATAKEAKANKKSK